MRVRRTTIHPHRDARGMILEPLERGELSRYVTIHIAVSEPQAVRGNHCHPHCEEVLIVSGPGLVRFEDGEECRDETVQADEVARFDVAPGVAHAVRNTGDSPSLVIVFSTRPTTNSGETVPVRLL